MSKKYADETERAERKAFKAALTRTLSDAGVQVAEVSMAKYSDEQPRDASGKWTASDSGSATGTFARSNGNAKISNDHRAYWGTAREGHFAQGYVAHVQSGNAEASPAKERMAEEFSKAYTTIGSRSGFVGSGEADYRHNDTGAVFHVERMANGKSFWGTDHSIREMPADYTPRNPTAAHAAGKVDVAKYSDDQPRDEQGRWTSGAGAIDAAERVVSGMAADPGMWGTAHRASLAASSLGEAMHSLREAGTNRLDRANAMEQIIQSLNDHHFGETRGALQMSHGDRIGAALDDLRRAQAAGHVGPGVLTESQAQADRLAADRAAGRVTYEDYRPATREEISAMHDRVSAARGEPVAPAPRGDYTIRASGGIYGQPVSYELSHTAFSIPTVRAEAGSGRVSMSSTGSGGIDPAQMADFKTMLDHAAELAGSTTKAERAEFAASLARTTSTLLSTPERVKYSDSQERDDRGRWTSSGGGGTDFSRPTQGYATVVQIGAVTHSEGSGKIPADASSKPPTARPREVGSNLDGGEDPKVPGEFAQRVMTGLNENEGAPYLDVHYDDKHTNVLVDTFGDKSVMQWTGHYTPQAVLQGYKDLMEHLDE